MIIKIKNEKKEWFLIKLTALIVIIYCVQSVGKRLINQMKS